ncbi:MAG: hypothetical protein CMF50_00080 [Legionellales bacterium]|nr:hypothetical protein [Legionellales bacterium]|tara:strand:+ start:3860 stop:4213 length:354 start_codon:yes stop_codon:yes gene_type:complete
MYPIDEEQTRILSDLKSQFSGKAEIDDSQSFAEHLAIALLDHPVYGTTLSVLRAALNSNTVLGQNINPSTPNRPLFAEPQYLHDIRSRLIECGIALVFAEFENNIEGELHHVRTRGV